MHPLLNELEATRSPQIFAGELLLVGHRKHTGGATQQSCFA